jgi:hypothetical protein
MYIIREPILSGTTVATTSSLSVCEFGGMTGYRKLKIENLGAVSNSTMSRSPASSSPEVVETVLEDDNVKFWRSALNSNSHK